MVINGLGIDIEEWFHICGIESMLKAQNPNLLESRVVDNTTFLLEILKEYKVKATFFILGSIAQKYPQLVKNINNSGHEIASHGFSHVAIYRQGRIGFETDLNKSIGILRAITGKRILGFRAPDFSIVKKSLWALDILKDAGVKYDCSIFPIFHPRYGIPGAKTFPHEIIDGLIEFPVSTTKVLGINFPIAGGAYLRILPYGFINRSIKKLNSQGISANLYLHPWEIDWTQPRLNIPLTRKFSHYSGLKNTLLKLKQLLSDFKFAPIREVLGFGDAE